MDVDDVQGQRAERVLNRARHVHGQGGGPPARGRERQHLADAEHDGLRLRPGQQRLGLGAQRPAAVAHERARERGCDDQDLVAASAQFVCGALDVLVDLVRGLPGERRHLGDGERAGRHCNQSMGRSVGGTAPAVPSAHSAMALVAGGATDWAGAPATAGLTAPRRCSAMNCSVSARASSSGRWFIGDFIR